jgi:hypothetical protein
MEDLGWTRRRGSSPVARRGRAAARGLDARIRFQHPFMPAGDTSHPNQINPIKNPLDSEHGIYRDLACRQPTLRHRSEVMQLDHCSLNTVCKNAFTDVLAAWVATGS